MTRKNGTNMDKYFSMERQQMGWQRKISMLGLFLGVGAMASLMNVLQAAELQALDFHKLPGDKSQIVLTFSESVSVPDSFATDEPARLVLDFNGVSNQLAEKTRQINTAETRSIATVEAGDRTRMVVNLQKKVPYQIDTNGNVVTLTLNSTTPAVSAATTPASATVASTPKTSTIRGNQVKDIDFRRGEQGEARLIIDLTQTGAAIDVHQERGNVVVDIAGVALPDNLVRRLDVLDFATPVSTIDAERSSKGTRFTLATTQSSFEHLAYQSDNQLVIEVKPIEVSEADRQRDELGYEGEKLSLNFQNIEVRAVLQLLADFNGINLVTSDTVTGNLTLRLKNVPWDQALEIILKTKGLDKRVNGNVMLVAPAAEIAAREKQELEARRQLVELEPLHSDIIEVNFAKASDIAEILESARKQGQQTGGSNASVRGFLSERGSVVVDMRTNALLLRDTASQLTDIRRLIERLDIPVRQVLIESRIVIASNDFSKELGVRFGASGRSRTLGIGTAPTLGGLTVTEGVTNPNLVTPATGTRALGQDLNVNLPVANPAGTVALALAKLPLGMILELELSAMQEEGRGEVVSSPRVITSNQRRATIVQGTEIPYQEASSSGATSVSFKEANLELDVTPQITPDDRIVMDLLVTKDEVGTIFEGVPSINTQRVETQVLVDNGETVVLGGIYEQTKLNSSSRVPFFGDLPLVGAMFRSQLNIDEQSELLIFVTPKIIKEGFAY